MRNFPNPSSKRKTERADRFCRLLRSRLVVAKTFSSTRIFPGIPNFHRFAREARGVPASFVGTIVNVARSLPREERNSFDPARSNFYRQTVRELPAYLHKRPLSETDAPQNIGTCRRNSS
ncbi:hypothetical protein CH375_04505 [Leptospira ellisii]|uniref:Uncharacterized protein n=1 Tax=Leptospira ellisii TaxID=2023197 RepID=A0A2N0BCK7_9LEPT|nr:hypothetical protein CH379_03470 [Leptospira ellisii]PKA05562.1 hypothetical protein CH375_04505 [Leptospira ellisii]